MEKFGDNDIKFFKNQQSWEQWLSVHVEEQAGIYIKLAKKGSSIQSITYAEALDVALCYGWIDGIKRSYDDQFFLQKFTPRRAKSMWSKRNIGIIERLTKEGLMQPSGIAAVEAAKADGRWGQAYDSPANITIPDDFQKALDTSPEALTFYNTLNKTNTYAILWRIQTAKKPETRQNRIEKIIAMLERKEKLH